MTSATSRSSDPRPPRPAPGAPRTALSDFKAGLRQAMDGDPGPDAEAAIEELFPEGRRGADFLARFASLILLSSSIAAFGLLADSSAVVIGAMLVAPLMTPILAVSAAMVRAQNARLLWAVAVIATGMVLAIATGYVVSAIAAQSIGDVLTVPKEVAARTEPGLLDLGVAVTAGAAGGYVLARKDALSALPGVGISVALVPPLATVGISLELGLNDDAAGALLLFATNLAAIVFSASIMLVLAGFRPHVRARGQLRRRFLATAVIVAVIAVPLTIHTKDAYDDNALRSQVVDAIPEWDDTVTVSSISASIDDGIADVEVQVVGPNDPLPAWRLSDAIRGRYGGPVDLVVFYNQVNRFEVSSR